MNATKSATKSKINKSKDTKNSKPKKAKSPKKPKPKTKSYMICRKKLLNWN